MDVKRLDRATAEITFDPHLFTRQLERNFDIDFVEETVRTGEVVEEKCETHKMCFRKYHGKEKQTYYVIGIFHDNLIEVKTTWLIKGK